MTHARCRLCGATVEARTRDSAGRFLSRDDQADELLDELRSHWWVEHADELRAIERGLHWLDLQHAATHPGMRRLAWP